MAIIVLIEDDVTLREVVATLLEIDGHTVFQAGDGESGLGLITQKRPDLVICDVGLPHLDGHAVQQAARGNAQTAHIPFLMLSGQDTLDGDYLTKPFASDELLRRVSTRLG